MKKIALALASVAALAVAAPAAAVQIATTVSADGPYLGTLSEINDNIIPPLMTPYNQMGVYNFGGTGFTYDFGGVKTVTDVLASVDNNDDYLIDFYNGASHVISFFIPASQGSVTAWEGGFDTFASFAAGGGATQLGGSALFQADHAIIHGQAGDGLFGIGEVQFFNNSVPEPSSWALMIGGFALAGAAMRRSRKTAVSFA